MIDISELRTEDFGRWVVYKPSFGDTQKGKLKSWNDKYIFVVYNCDHQWDRFDDFTAAATNPEDLTFTTIDENIPTTVFN